MLETNEYFEGKVKSIALQNQSGRSTVGVMAPGEYEFGTATIEIMQVVSGKMTVKLPESSEWKTYQAGEIFEVAANKKFELKIEEDAAYLCTYK